MFTRRPKSQSMKQVSSLHSSGILDSPLDTDSADLTPDSMLPTPNVSVQVPQSFSSSSFVPSGYGTLPHPSAPAYVLHRDQPASYFDMPASTSLTSSALPSASASAASASSSSSFRQSPRVPSSRSHRSVFRSPLVPHAPFQTGETVLTVADKPLPSRDSLPQPSSGGGNIQVASVSSSLHLANPPAVSILNDSIRRAKIERMRATKEVHRPEDPAQPWWQAAPFPPPRTRYSATTLPDGRLLVFGGTGSLRKGGSTHCFSDLWTLDTHQWVWYEHSNVVGDVPSARYGHTATFFPDYSTEAIAASSDASKNSSTSNASTTSSSSDDDNDDDDDDDRGEDNTVDEDGTMTRVASPSMGRRQRTPPTYQTGVVVVFGGKALDNKLLNDVYVLHLSEMRWEKLDIAPQNAPTPRFLHSAARLGPPAAMASCGSERAMAIGIFGGKSEKEPFSRDFCVLDLSNKRWVVPTLAGKPPKKRAGHFSFMYGVHHLVICGGTNRYLSLHEDVWAVNWAKMTWIKPRLKRAPKSMQSTQMAPYFALLGNKLFSFQYDHMQNSTVAFLDVDDFTWKFGQLTGELSIDPKANYTVNVVQDSQLFLNLSGPLPQIVALVSIAPDFQNSLESRFRWREFDCVRPTVPQTFEPEVSSSEHVELEIRFAGQRPRVIEFALQRQQHHHHQQQQQQRANEENHSLRLLRTSMARDLGLAGVHLLYFNARKDRFGLVSTVSILARIMSQCHHQMPYNTLVLWAVPSQATSGLHDRSERLNFLVRAAEGLEENRIEAAGSLSRSSMAFPAPNLGAVDVNSMSIQYQEIPDAYYEEFGDYDDDDDDDDENNQEEHSIMIQMRVNESKPRRSMASTAPAGVLVHADDQFPMQRVFGPTRAGLLRTIHDRMIKIEQRGLSFPFLKKQPINYQDESLLNPGGGGGVRRSRARFAPGSSFSWFIFIETLLKMLLLPLFAVYLLVFGWWSYTVPAIVTVFFSSLFPVIALVLPITASPSSVLAEGAAYGPIFLWVFVSFILSTLNARWVDIKGQTRKLRKYHAKVQHYYPDHSYLSTVTTAEDLAFSITSKEQTSPDKPGVLINCIVFGLLGSLCHTGGSLIFIYFFTKKTQPPFGDGWTQDNVLLLVSEVLSFVSYWMFFACLGICLSVYQRQLLHFNFFNELTRESAKRSDFAHMQLCELENVMCWMKLRDYLVKHEFLPLGTADILLGWTLAIVFVIWIIVIVEVFYFFGQPGSAGLFTGTNIMVVVDLLVLSCYVAAALLLGGSISAQKTHHAKILQKEKVKLILAHQHNKTLVINGSKSVPKAQLQEEKSTIQLIDSMISVIDRQPAFRVLGLGLGETGLKFATGLLVPICIAVITRLLAELARLNSSTSTATTTTVATVATTTATAVLQATTTLLQNL